MIQFFSDGSHKAVRAVSSCYVFDLAGGNLPPWFNHRLRPNGLYACFFSHEHEFVEIIAVTRGSILVQLDNTEHVFRAGEVMIANPYTMHSGCLADPSEVTEYFCARIDTEDFAPDRETSLSADIAALIDGEACFDDHLDGEAAETLTELLAVLNGSFAEPDSTVNQCEMTAAVMRVLGFLFTSHFHRTFTPTAKRRAAFSRAVGSYVRDNFREPITTPDIAQALGYTETYFCRLFRDYFGTNFSRFLNKYRITRAAADYCGSLLPIAEIAAEVGFPDYNYFSRVFRRYFGMSPREYYRRRTDTAPTLPTLSFYSASVADRKKKAKK